MKVTKTKNSITLEFADEELSILGDSLLDPLAHFETIASEKLANCRQRIFQEWGEKLRKDKRVGSIPTDDKALLDLILAQPDYKDRKSRETALIPK